jgi:hypothetical protein
MSYPHSKQLLGETLHVALSGKEVVLPPPPPLRTVRASFPAYGSSLSKSHFRETGFSNFQPLDWTWRAFTIRACSFLTVPLTFQSTFLSGDAHTLTSCVLICFSPVQKILQTLLRRETSWKSARFRAREFPCIRSITDRPSLPPTSFTHIPSAFLTVRLPSLARIWAYRVPLQVTERGRTSLYAGSSVSVIPQGVGGNTRYVSFCLQPISTFGWLRLTTSTRVHLCCPCHSSLAPRCGVLARLGALSPELHTYSLPITHVRVGYC